MNFNFFCNPRLIPKKIHPPFDFRENSSSFDFRENPFKTSKENQKNCFSFAPCVFWICFKGLFAVVPLDLNFTNPKSTIFEPDFVSCARAGPVGNIGKISEKSVKIPQYRRYFRRFFEILLRLLRMSNLLAIFLRFIGASPIFRLYIGDFADFLAIFPWIDNQWRLSFR